MLIPNPHPSIPHYLVKPVTYDRVKKALDRCKYVLTASSKSAFFTAGGKEIRLPLRKIRYVEVFRNQTVIHADSDIMLRSTLDTVMHQISDSRFLRTHCSFLVNMDYITKRCGNDLYLSSEASESDRGGTLSFTPETDGNILTLSYVMNRDPYTISDLDYELYENCDGGANWRNITRDKRVWTHLHGSKYTGRLLVQKRFQHLTKQTRTRLILNKTIWMKFLPRHRVLPLPLCVCSWESRQSQAAHSRACE